ncbi:hypothetical protein ACFYT4_22935 [Streptomyces sp. NPDC004609]|uniref:hypothetical protein n=1 Tax=Streptomyces sp. NPDC004609 TaxID=3364704 RepID=UPI0036C63595
MSYMSCASDGSARAAGPDEGSPGDRRGTDRVIGAAAAGAVEWDACGLDHRFG